MFKLNSIITPQETASFFAKAQAPTRARGVRIPMPAFSRDLTADGQPKRLDVLRKWSKVSAAIPFMLSPAIGK
jgi:hypothetical protein